MSTVPTSLMSTIDSDQTTCRNFSPCKVLVASLNQLAILMLYIALEPSCHNFLINFMYVTVTIDRDALDLEKTLDEYKHPKVQFTAFCAFFEFLKAKLFLKMLLTATKYRTYISRIQKAVSFFFEKKGFSFDHKLKQKVALSTET